MAIYLCSKFSLKCKMFLMIDVRQCYALSCIWSGDYSWELLCDCNMLYCDII